MTDEDIIKILTLEKYEAGIATYKAIKSIIELEGILSEQDNDGEGVKIEEETNKLKRNIP